MQNERELIFNKDQKEEVNFRQSTIFIQRNK